MYYAIFNDGVNLLIFSPSIVITQSEALESLERNILVSSQTSLLHPTVTCPLFILSAQNIK